MGRADEGWPEHRKLRNRSGRGGLQDTGNWLEWDLLPREITPTDLDGVFHDRVHDRILFLEYKPSSVALSQGQLQTLQTLVRQGNWAFVVACSDNGHSGISDDTPISISAIQPTTENWTWKWSDLTMWDLKHRIMLPFFDYDKKSYVDVATDIGQHIYE